MHVWQRRSRAPFERRITRHVRRPLFLIPVVCNNHITYSMQENYFFDGAKRELSSQRFVVRTRFYNVDKRCLLTIKVSMLRPCPAHISPATLPLPVYLFSAT